MARIKISIFELAIIGLAFAGSRTLIALYGITPNPTYILNHWQHADLFFLEFWPFETLWNLHSQPPLWNAFIALVVGFAGNDAESVSSIFKWIFTGFSFVNLLLFRNIFQRIGLFDWWATLAAIVIVMTPSVIYYENFAFYPQFTFTLITVLLWLLVRISTDASLLPIIGALLVLTCLAWTWAIFHPLIILFISLTILWKAGRLLWPAGLLLVLLFGIISSLPAAKNQINYGIPSASTWLGFNMAQVAPDFSEEEKTHCALGPTIKSISEQGGLFNPSVFPTLSTTKKSSGYFNMNNEALVARSAECLSLARAHIRENFGQYVREGLDRIWRNHQTRPYDYFLPPLGWENVSAFIKRNTMMIGGMSLSFYVAMWVFCVYQMARGPDQKLYFILLVVLGYFAFASHFGNGGEQQRMRYTIEPIYMFLAVGLLHRLAGFALRNRQLSRTYSQQP